MTSRNGSPPITVSGSGTSRAANPHRRVKSPSCSCAKPRSGPIAPKPWSLTAFPAPPAFTSATLPSPMTIFRRPSSSTTRRAMPISPTGSARIPASQRRFPTPSHCGCSVESTRPCRLPTALSPAPSRQRMLRRWVLRSYSRRCWGSFGIATKQSRPTAIGRYRVSIRSPSPCRRLRRFFSGLGKVVRRCRRVGGRRDATRPCHLSGAR